MAIDAYRSAKELEGDLVAARDRITESQLALIDARELIEGAFGQVGPNIRFQHPIEAHLSSLTSDLFELTTKRQSDVPVGLVLEELDELLELVRVSVGGDDGR